MESYESVLLVKQKVFVFKNPPLSTNHLYRASEWNLITPDWTGRLRLVSKQNHCSIVLEDRVSGELYAKCPIDTYPGLAIQSVADSSRYFVLRLQNDDGKSAFIGLGFDDRSDSFDLNVALQDHFKWLKKEQEIADEPPEGAASSLDLRFKEGETIKINMKIAKRDGADSSKTKSKNSNNNTPTFGGGSGLLPPPPASGKLPAPPGQSSMVSPTHTAKNITSIADTVENREITGSKCTTDTSNWVQF